MYLGGFLHYDRKKKVLVVCLAGARSLLQPEKKSSSRLSGGYAIAITTGKKGLVVCLAGAPSLLRPEKKVLVLCRRVHDHYYDRKKKF